MVFQSLCIEKIFSVSGREEALSDYSSLLKALDYDEETGAIYASMYENGYNGLTIKISEDDLKSAEFTEGHGCSYICKKYGLKDTCKRCPMHGQKDVNYIRGEKTDLSQRNLIELDKVRVQLIDESEKEDAPTATADIPEEKEEASEQQSAISESVCAEDNEEAAEREYRLLVHILSQTPARVKTVLPAEKEDMEKIKALFVSRMNVAAEGCTPQLVDLNARVYELIYNNVTNKILGRGSDPMVTGLKLQMFMAWLGVESNDIICDSTREKIEAYYEKLYSASLTYARDYAKFSASEKRKAREQAYSLVKKAKIETKKASGSSKKKAYEGNMSLFDEQFASNYRDSEEIISARSGNKDEPIAASETEAGDCFAVDEFKEIKNKIKKDDSGDKTEPKEEQQTEDHAIESEAAPAAEEELPAPENVPTPGEAKEEINPHAVIPPSEELDAWLQEEHSKLIETKIQREEPKPQQKTEPKQKEKQTKQREAKAADAARKDERDEIDTSKPLFTDDCQLIGAAKENKEPKPEKKGNVSEENGTPIIRDSKDGCYYYEVSVDEKWLKDNGFMMLDALGNEKASELIMYSFMQSIVDGVEVVREDSSKGFLFLLFFEDIGRRCALKTSSPVVERTLKHYLTNDKLYKKVSTCPMAVFAACAMKGFMPKHIHYAGGYTRPYGTFAPAERIQKHGFEAYLPVNWKKTRTSRTDEVLLNFEMALSRSLYIGGEAAPFISISDGKYSFRNIEKVSVKEDRIVLTPEFKSSISAEDFRRFIDKIIRKLEENNTFYKYKTYISHLDYSKKTVSFVMRDVDYRAFNTCLIRLAIRFANKMFRIGQVPRIYYATRRIPGTATNKNQSNQQQQT